VVSPSRIAALALTSLTLALGAGLATGVVLGDGPEVINGSLLTPYRGNVDPGPTAVLGSDEQPGGVQYLWSNINIDGTGSYRIYFDYRGKKDYHFLDRQGHKITLGLCEAGIEQTFVTAALANTGLPLRLVRHGTHIGLFQDGRLITCAEDDRLAGGAVGWRMISNEPAVTVKVEPREDIHFADDFMTTEGKSSQWRGNGSPEKGDFGARSLRHQLLSANAFVYMGAGKNVYSVVGHPWWDQYRLDTSMRGPAGQTIGIVFAFQDDKNYGLFRWSARQEDELNRGSRELVKVRDGQEVVLARSQGGYAPDNWYNISVRVAYARTTVSVDGHALLEASDPCLASGAAGVWCDVALPATLAQDPKAQPFQTNSLHELMKQHAVYDDFRVSTLDGIEDDFRVAGPLAGGWLVGTGTWMVEKPAGSGSAPGVLKVGAGMTAAKALIGERRWSQYELETDVESSAPAGIVILHRDESNYYNAIVENGSLRLVRMADGKETPADSATFRAAEGPIRLKASIRHGHIRVSARSVKDPAAPELAAVEAFEADGAPKGRAGLLVMPGRGTAAFSRFRLSFLPEREPLVTTNAIFEGETLMNDWTNPTSDWYPPKEQVLVEGRPVNLLWHRSQFPGDVELTVEPREIAEPKFEVALSVAKDGQGKNNGYVFRYRAGDAGEGPSRNTTLLLVRQGETVAEKVLAEDVRQLTSLSIRRCGRYVVGMVNGRALVSYRDDDPLEGNRVAFYTQGLTVRTEAIKIVSDHFRNELFSTAPTTWRTAGAAIAEVTNRWQCDPRWSFFSLKNDRRVGKPAVLWSKALYPGDVSIEFYFGNKMEGERGAPYTYARDVNVTICSDGSDLTKGYTCSFGGQDNAGSMIYRDGVEVKRVGKAIPRDMNYHRHYFSMKVEKRGNQVSFRVDRFFVSDTSKSGELIYEDTQPLNGNRVAIWTYDHAITISRVRISGEGGNTFEHPDWMPGPLKTPYDR